MDHSDKVKRHPFLRPQSETAPLGFAPSTKQQLDTRDGSHGKMASTICGKKVVYLSMAARALISLAEG